MDANRCSSQSVTDTVHLKSGGSCIGARGRVLHTDQRSHHTILHGTTAVIQRRRSRHGRQRTDVETLTSDGGGEREPTVIKPRCATVD